MKAGIVVGRVWSAKKIEALPAGALLCIELDDGQGRIVAFDPLGCGEGEHVLVASGSVAQSFFSPRAAVIDALIVAALDVAVDANGAVPGAKT